MPTHEMDKACSEAYDEYLAALREYYREVDAERFNSPVGKFAPSDFVYDPLGKAGFE